MAKIPPPPPDMTMTKAHALRIQADQIARYSRWHPGAAALIAAATTADALPDGHHDMATINRCIPRGGAIERILGIAQEG